ncbi:DUF3618 domain-containing protein [Cereibacter changlensis]|uniref:DUF3618 domain-containing protein n=1 Tax=Cereibacter changlensis TaxID=402884 RepID=UPI004033ED5F
MSDTADHLEREVEARRASVESTLDALKDRMSVNQVIDEVGQFIGVEDARAALHTAGRQVRENPVALGMIGLGLAWLVLGNSGKDRRPGYDGYAGRSGSYEPYSGGSRDWGDERSGRGVIDKVVGAVSGAAESVGHAASAAGGEDLLHPSAAPATGPRITPMTSANVRARCATAHMTARRICARTWARAATACATAPATSATRRPTGPTTCATGRATSAMPRPTARATCATRSRPRWNSSPC